MNKKTRSIEKTDATTVFLHWGFVVTLIFSLLTGLRISADAPDAFWSKALDPILIQGDVMLWHVWAAYGLTLVALGYVIFMVRARLQGRVALDGARVQGMATGDRVSRWKGVNVMFYWLAFGLIFLAAITGLLLYIAPGLLPHAWVSTLHAIIAWLMIAYVALHVGGQLAQGGLLQLLKILNPQSAYGGATVAMAVIVIGLGVGLYALDKLTVSGYQVTNTDQIPTLDGNPDDPVWRQSERIDILTNRGVNQPGGEVAVSMNMVHDNDHLYAMFRWPDSTRSQKHLPLQKTAKGWRVVQKEYGIQDEDDYYEDKFGVMLAHTPAMAGAGTTHLGGKPLADKPAPSGGRGLHYTTDGSIVDVWHWKSVRTGSPDMNQIDDNFFGPPLEPKGNGKRYTGGYSKDPKTGGGFKMNWEKYSDDIITPKRLPMDPAMLSQLGYLNLDPSASDDGQFWMKLEDTIAYSEELDTYPVGTVMPSVLVDGPFEGDRGDVRTVAKWQDGWWTLEISRKLDTGSKYDTALGHDKPTYLWVAVFDHAQTRHSMHLHPVQLNLEK